MFYLKRNAKHNVIYTFLFKWKEFFFNIKPKSHDTRTQDTKDMEI